MGTEDTQHPSEEGNAKEEFIRVDVRLLSGAPLLSRWLASSSSVQSLLDAAVAAVNGESHTQAASLLLNNAIVDKRASSLKNAGIEHDSVLTLVRRAEPPLWSQAHLGDQATVSEETDQGVVVLRSSGYSGAVVVARCPARHFRVRVIDNSGDWAGAMELGFTSTHPNELVGSMPLAGDLPNRRWVMHNAGRLKVDGVRVFGNIEPKSNWHEALAPDDMVRVAIVNPSGGGTGAAASTEFVVEVNGEAKLKAAIADVDPALTLFPVVGVYGKTTAVELLHH